MATMDPFDSNVMSDYPMAEQAEDLMDVGLELDTQSIGNEDIDIDLDFSEELQQDEVMTEGDNYGSRYGLQLDDNGALDKDDDEMADEDQEFQLVDEEIIDAPSGLVDELHAGDGNAAERKDPNNIVTGFVSFPNAKTDIDDEGHTEQVREIESTAKSKVITKNGHTDFFDDTVSTDFQPTLSGNPLELQLDDDHVHIPSLQDQPHARAIQTHETNGQSSASPATANHTSSAANVEEVNYTFNDDTAATFNEDLFAESAAAEEIAGQSKEPFSEETKSISVEAKNTVDSSEAPGQTDITELSATSPRIAIHNESENQNSQHDDISNHSGESTESPDEETLHPITLRYLDDEMSLFPPREDEDSDMYFLADQALVNEHVGSLFEAFRSVLGESINEGEELSLEIYALDLEISEIAEEASTITLAQLLQLYLKLTRNDNSDCPDPLHLRLKRRHKFLARLNHLRRLADQGKGLQEHLVANTTGDEEEKHSEPLYHEDQERDEYDVEPSESKSEQVTSTQASPHHTAEGLRTRRKPDHRPEHDGFNFDLSSPQGVQRATGGGEGHDRNTIKSVSASDLVLKAERSLIHETEANLGKSQEVQAESAEANGAETPQFTAQGDHRDTESVNTSGLDDIKETLEHDPSIINGAPSAEYSGDSSTLHGDEEDPAINFNEDEHPTDTHSFHADSPAEIHEELLVDDEGFDFGVEDDHKDDHPLAQADEIFDQDQSGQPNSANVAVIESPIQRKTEQIEKVGEINKAPEAESHSPGNLLSHHDEIDFSDDDDDDDELRHDDIGGANSKVQLPATPPESLKRLRSPEEDFPAASESPKSKKARPE